VESYYLASLITAVFLGFLALETAYLFLIPLGILWFLGWMPYLRLSLGCDSLPQVKSLTDFQIKLFLQNLMVIEDLLRGEAITREEADTRLGRARDELLGPDEWLLARTLYSLLRVEYIWESGRPSEAVLDDIVRRFREEGRTI
jgi:hypothetical protein